MFIITTALVFLLILSILVLVHELGHFLVAKKLGVKVEEFGFGFPPKVWGKKFGETLYSINLLPIGGFVKLYGEDEAGGGSLQLPKNSKNTNSPRQETKDQDRAFFSRPIWQRAVIVVAGVFMNFVLAVVIFSYLFAFQGVPTPGNTVSIVAVSHNSPAEKAGLKQGDVIVSIDSNKITDSKSLISYTKLHLGTKMIFFVKRNKEAKTFSITPRIHAPVGEGAMGVALNQDTVVKRYPWYQAPFIGTEEALKDSWLIVQGIGTAFSQAAVQRKVPEGVAGPIGIAQLTGEFVKIGPNAVLSLLSLFSLNLAIVNLLPIPGLDGGRFFFILIEAITRRKTNPKFEAYAHTAGLAFLLGIFALISYYDLVRIFSGQSLIPR